MPETGGRKKKHLQHSSLLLRKGVVVAVRKSGAGFAHRSGEQGAPLTPVPTWKLYKNPSYQSHVVATVGRAASVTGLMEGEDTEDGENNEEEEKAKIWVQGCGNKGVDREDTVPHTPFISARKLAASLWEELQEDGQEEEISTICDFSESSPCSHFQRKASSLSTSESPDSLNHHHSFKAPTRRQEASRNSQRPTTLSPPLKAIMLMEPSAAGVASRLRGSVSKASNFQGEEAREELVELSNKYESSDITSPCGFIEASCRSQALERTPQMDTSCFYLDLPFSEELKRALSKVQQVETAQISARKEVDSLLRRCADEILMLRTREQEKIQAAVLSIAEQLEKERKVKRNVEVENRRLASSLTDANKAILAAKEELEKERKARQLMEDVCDELAKEIGEDKTEAEELRRELAKVREEIEEERKTFQMTEAWREERVQMKLSEAKLELEERCTALDNLKMELELFLERGKVHRVEGGGEILRGVVKRLQEDCSESLFFRKEAKGLLSPGNNEAISSDKSRSQKNSWSSNEDGSIMHMNMYDNNGIHRILRSPEPGQNTYGWNVESDRLYREEDYNGLASANSHLDKHDGHWISCMRLPGQKAGMKSYGSKARGLSSLDDQGIAGDIYNDLDYRSRAGSDDSGVGGDQSSECGSSSKEDTDFDYANGLLRLRSIGLHSASEAEEEGGWKFSPKSSSRKVTKRSVEMVNVKRRQGGARVKQHPGGNGRKLRAEQSYDAESHRKYVCSQTKWQGDNEFLSLTGYSPAYKGHLPSPDPLAQQGTNQTQKGTNWTQKGLNRSKHSALLGMKAVYNSVDWSKPYKRNSLQAKLLLEDRLSGGDFKLMHC